MNTWDETKRRTTLAERGLDFADAEAVFSGRVMTIPDDVSTRTLGSRSARWNATPV
jgi:uncharacterized DUF497 family protein